MINVLVNAYAVNPYWGSEQGMGWNWVVNIARYCNVYVITEGEFRDNIEEAMMSLSQKDHLHFYYNPLPTKVRKMCWNQGDWRFYWYYRNWQKQTLKIAKQIIKNNRIDILHQLNMIGFREPGYLWKIKEVPFVWGPIGGMELMPMEYLLGVPMKQRLFNYLKNIINQYQYLYSSRVHAAIQKADILIGIDSNSTFRRKTSKSDEPFKIIWIGKFDFRKQLPIAIKSITAMNQRNVELHICGTGNDDAVNEMKRMAEICGIASKCHWHGNVSHDKILKMMASSDLMFFTSIMEATSTVVLEAITVGFGPIVKDFAGITVELSNPYKSVQDFAHELSLLYQNRAVLNDISTRMLEKRQELTWEAKAKKLVRHYEEILKK